jgi:hypothetical protein
MVPPSQALAESAHYVCSRDAINDPDGPLVDARAISVAKGVSYAFLG